MSGIVSFSGSYPREDVCFLLKPVALAPTELSEKERLIQSGARHYSEMISAERPPGEEYLQWFHGAMRRHGERFAGDIAALARLLAERIEGPLTLVSLARAGTPIGILLKRTLRQLGREAAHYSISVIRGRGMDAEALDHILERHDARSLAFVDGWTGKGAIADELERSVRRYNRRCGAAVSDRLSVVSDLCGAASFAASADDYLIPCSMLNAVVSGLVSRSILNPECVGPGDFHGCVFYEEMAESDLSRWFIDAMMERIEASLRAAGAERPGAIDPLGACNDPSERARRRMQTAACVRQIRERCEVVDANRVKPGIGEATRALLRRMPERLLIRQRGGDDTAHLEWLAAQRGVAVERAEWLPSPYQAAAVIRTVGQDGRAARRP